MATVGLLASTAVGGVLVVLARRLGWLKQGRATPEVATPEAATPAATEAAGSGASGAAHGGSGLADRVAAWLVNLALTGLAVGIGWLLLALLRAPAARLGGAYTLVIDTLPVFPLALVGSLLMRLLLERTGRAGWVSGAIQGRIGTLSADLLIAAATACLDLSLLARDWLPLTVLASVGLVWNLAVVLLLGRRLLPEPWFERGIIEFGQATGVAASGLLLLSMADPEDEGNAITPFSIKQLLLQPLLAGGVITVVMPLLVESLGLPLWTALCGAVVVLAAGLGLALAAR
jgi:ESS family glutamate:Na+ symporter